MRCFAWGRETAKLVRARHLRWALWDHSLSFLTFGDLLLSPRAQRSLIAWTVGITAYGPAQRSASRHKARGLYSSDQADNVV